MLFSFWSTCSIVTYMSLPLDNVRKKPPLQRTQWVCLVLWGREHCPALKDLLREKDAKREKDVGLTAVNCPAWLKCLCDRAVEQRVVRPPCPALFAAYHAPLPWTCRSLFPPRGHSFKPPLTRAVAQQGGSDPFFWRQRDLIPVPVTTP